MIVVTTQGLHKVPKISFDALQYNASEEFCHRGRSPRRTVEGDPRPYPGRQFRGAGRDRAQTTRRQENPNYHHSSESDDNVLLILILPEVDELNPPCSCSSAELSVSLPSSAGALLPESSDPPEQRRVRDAASTLNPMTIAR